jgi:metal-sulfur cluster biosynthetic enzyme
MSPSKHAVMEALKEVPEPCSISMRTPVNICEMGLVDEVIIDGGDVRVVLVLTDPSCAHFMSMRSYIADVLAKVEGVASVEVQMSTTKLWTSDRALVR